MQLNNSHFGINARQMRMDRFAWAINVFLNIVFGIFFVLYAGCSEWWFAFLSHCREFPHKDRYIILPDLSKEEIKPDAPTGFIPQTEIEDQTEITE
jgi:hypothetical protein